MKKGIWSFGLSLVMGIILGANLWADFQKNKFYHAEFLFF